MGATIPMLSVWTVPRLDAGISHAVAIDGWEPEEEALVVAGIRLPTPLPSVTVTRRTEGRLPEMMGSLSSVRLVSERIYTVLARALREGVQFIPASITGYDKPYYIPNLLEHRACATDPDGRLLIATDDLPPLFRVRDLPAIWLVRADLERKIRSDLAGDFVSLHQFRLDNRSGYRSSAEDRWP